MKKNNSRFSVFQIVFLSMLVLGSISAQANPGELKLIQLTDLRSENRPEKVLYFIINDQAAGVVTKPELGTDWILLDTVYPVPNYTIKAKCTPSGDRSCLINNEPGVSIPFSPELKKMLDTFKKAYEELNQAFLP